jgi:hypothetical protein
LRAVGSDARRRRRCGSSSAVVAAGARGVGAAAAIVAPLLLCVVARGFVAAVGGPDLRARCRGEAELLAGPRAAEERRRERARRSARVDTEGSLSLSLPRALSLSKACARARSSLGVVSSVERTSSGAVARGGLAALADVTVSRVALVATTQDCNRHLENVSWSTCVGWRLGVCQNRGEELELRVF